MFVFISSLFLSLLTLYSYDIDPFYINALERGEQHYLAQDYSSALKNLKIAVFGLNKDNILCSKAHTYIALTYFNLKNLQDSKKHLDRVLELLGDQDFTVLNMPASVQDTALQLFSHFSLTDSQATSSSKQEDRPKEKKPRQQEPQNESVTRSHIRQLEKIIRKDPSKTSPFYELYSLYRELKDTKKAIKILHKLLEAHSDERRAHFLLGLSYYNTENYIEAESHFGKAFSLSEANEDDIQVIEIKAYLILTSYSKGNKKQAKMHATGWEERILQHFDQLVLDEDEKEKLRVIFKFI